MTTAAVMLVKDEADILGYSLDYLETQVDAIYAADNGSTDGSREILADRGHLTADETGYRYSEIVSGLARKAYDDGHSWIVPVDADEAWVAPIRIRLGDWLARLAPGIVYATGAHLNHVPSQVDRPNPDPLRQIAWRRPERGWAKVAARAHPALTISWGAHDAVGPIGRKTGYIAVHHFQWRSLEQTIAKIRRGIAAHKDLPVNDNDEHWTRWRDQDDDAIAAWYYEEVVTAADKLVYDPVYR